jgi:ABC-type transport system involved in multi-copper enzyme maturation permease subunit
MTATTSARSPFVAMTRYTVKTAIPARRWALALVPTGVSMLFGLLAQAFDGTATHNFARVAAVALFGLVLPVAGLVIGDAVLGAEVRRGTFAFTWLSPVPVWQVVAARWLGGAIVATACVAPAFAAAAFVAGVPESAGPAALAGAVGGAAYVAVFMAIGAIAKRAAAWSLGFVFIGERLLGEALTGIAQISPSWEARALFVGLADTPAKLEREGIPHGWAALIRLAIIAVVALLIAASRLRRLRLAGASD